MSEPIDVQLVDRFRCAVEARVGLSFAPGRNDELTQILQKRAAAHGGKIVEYLARLEAGELHDELRELAPVLTVAETYFFRSPSQLDAFRALAQQHLLEAGPSPRPFRVLSAGCASGEEAYSLAIVAREVFAGRTQLLRVVGVDLNPRVLERARAAQYSEWSLRAIDADVRARWFRGRGSEIRLEPTIAAAVSFAECNLVAPDPELLGEGQWDVIFCRNVLMYFSTEQARTALGHLTRALTPAGYLFLGHAENLRDLSQAFHLRHTHEAFYYQRKPSHGPLARSTTSLLASPASGVERAPNANWAAAIERATSRVRALDTAGPAAASAAAATRDLGPVLELMQSDRYAEALALLNAASGDNGDPDRLLLEAALLTYGNRFTAAELVCRRLLQQDELSAAAHYVLALCRDAAGAHSEALHHDEVAAYLDPDFAMPHVHRGLLLRRLGQRDAARRSLVQAHALLEREDTARLAMFGGGFGRAALLALCAADHDASGAVR